MTLFVRRNPTAFSAVALSGLRQVAVLIVVLVAVFAMRPGAGVCGAHGYRWTRSDSAREIDLSRDWLQMSGVDARTDTTEMVEIKAGRYWLDVEFVRDSMRARDLRWALSADSHHAVTLSVKASCPEPASAFCHRQHVTRKLLSERRDWFRHISILAQLRWRCA